MPSITSERPVPAPSSSPTILLDAVTDAGLPPGPLDVAESISLLRALSAVPDPRQARGRRHGLQSILVLAAGGAGRRPLLRGDRAVVSLRGAGGGRGRAACDHA